MPKSYMEPYNYIEENSTIVVHMTNAEGHMFASVGLPWVVDYHADEVEQSVAQHSNIIIQMAFALLEQRFMRVRNYLNNEWENPENKYEITIRKATWGSQINSEYNNVEVGIQ